MYPLLPCDTNPLITFGDITLRNITVHGSYLPPGIIRCDKTNPCYNLVFDNVKASGWWHYLGVGYIVENAFGTVTDSKPVPAFVTPEGDGFVGDDDFQQLVALIWQEFVGLFRNDSNELAESLHAALTIAKGAYKLL